MQTKHRIEQLLDGMGVRPNRRHGQNFLIDLNLVRYLLDEAAPTPDDVVLEVGPGTGSMTQELAVRAGKVIACEIDKTLAAIADNELSEFDNVEVICGDVLSGKHRLNAELLERIAAARQQLPGRFLLVANLPYNAGTPVMMNLIQEEPWADAMYVTVQKEVAFRMVAEPGHKAYGILSILMNITGQPKLLKVLKPECFWPRPEVESAMVRWVRDEEKVGQIKDMGLLMDVVSLFMQHRRKMLKALVRFANGQLAEVDWSSIFSASQIDPQIRPDRLSPQQYLQIANMLAP